MISKINKEFMDNIGIYLKEMEKTAKRMNAPVLKVEDFVTDPFNILLYTLLSSRTKDATTLAAFKRLTNYAGNTPKQISKLNVRKIESLIKPVGFYKTKARHVKEMCKMLDEKFGGSVPQNIKDLLLLPGVGVKTANIVLARAFGKPVIGVDTHVHRISNRIGIINTKTPLESSMALNRIIGKKYRKRFNRVLVGFGQVVCLPVKPKCNICPIRKICFRRGVR